MSGTSIPYQLRPSKAVDRALFIQALRKLNNFINISELQYIGLGGPFLEDFKVFHHELKIENMICIEADENVRERQKFNKPLSCIDFLNHSQSTTEFINNHAFDKGCIVWLDFVSFSDLYTQLTDLTSLLNKLSDGDVFKITLNANSANLGFQEQMEDQAEKRLRKFKSLVTSEFEPPGLTIESMYHKEFPKALLESVKRAISKGIASAPNLKVMPISTFEYEDGQRMLTVTGIVISQDKEQDFWEKTRLASWSFHSKEWEAPLNITLPTMSTRERLLVEQMLPGVDYSAIRGNMGFYIGMDEKHAQSQMENFISYYRSFPWFGKVSLP